MGAIDKMIQPYKPARTGYGKYKHVTVKENAIYLVIYN